MEVYHTIIIRFNHTETADNQFFIFFIHKFDFDFDKE